MDLLRIESHQLKNNTINIIQNCDNDKYFVLDKNGWFNASQYFDTLIQCYEYAKQTYGLKLKEVK